MMPYLISYVRVRAEAIFILTTLITTSKRYYLHIPEARERQRIMEPRKWRPYQLYPRDIQGQLNMNHVVLEGPYP